VPLVLIINNCQLILLILCSFDFFLFVSISGTITVGKKAFRKKAFGHTDFRKKLYSGKKTIGKNIVNQKNIS
jgi:hypothetical protein